MWAQIPAQHQRMVRFAYWSYLGFFVCITVNWFAALMAMCVISPGDNRLVGFLLACVYWFAGLPGAWVLWCGPSASSVGVELWLSVVQGSSLAYQL